VVSSSITPAEHAADRALQDVSERFRLVSSLTPTNLRSEREAFMNGERKNPRFEYSVDDVELSTLHELLEGVSVPRTPVGELLEAKRVELMSKVELLRAIGTERFTTLSRQVYGVPDAMTLEEARAALKASTQPGPEPASETRLSARAVAEAMQAALDQYNLDDWTVNLSEKTVAGVVVNPQTQRIDIAAHTSLEVSRLAPLITHEIETHVLTAENGREQPLSLFVQGFAGYLRTQEGLAAYNVSTQHPQQGRPLRFWARNAIAVDLAQRLSFREVFTAVHELGFNEMFAFGVAAKVKRGLVDTSLPGGWTKDYVYLAGRRDIVEYVAAGGKLQDLYVGKVSTAVVPKLKQLSWIKPPRLLPRFVVTERADQ